LPVRHVWRSCVREERYLGAGFRIAGFRYVSPGGTPAELQKGSWVTGKWYVEIDPFFYFESGAKIPGVPPLVYTWRIEEIQQQTAPFIEVAPRHFERDSTKLGWREIEGTMAWEDDGVHAEYKLRCRLSDVPPKHRSRNCCAK
jgi:hypothetical protein